VSRGVPEGFEAVTDYVEEELRFATSHYNDSYLQRRIKSRMRRTGSEDYAEYLSLLRGDDAEGEELLAALSINVTGFFRNPEVWDGVRDVLRRLTGDRPAVRVWSAACADGREPYSLAMLCLDDPGIDEDAVAVQGTDINREALDRAERGLYESNHTSDLDDQLDYLDHNRRYVERDGDRFQVTDRVKELVTFAEHDIIRDPISARYELVLCRNLFIYIDSEFKTSVVDSVSSALVEGGYLVIGKAETIPRDAAEEFRVVDSKKRIYERA